MAELLVAILTTATNLVGSNSCHFSLPFHHPISRALCSRWQRSFVPCSWRFPEEASKSKIWNRRMLCWWSAQGGKPPWSKALSWYLRLKEIACAIDDRPASRFTQLPALPQTLPARHRTRRSSKPHSLSQVRLTILTHFHIMYPLILDVAIKRSSWKPITRQAIYPRMVTICSDARFPWSIVSQQNRRTISHNELMRYPLLNACQNCGNDTKREMRLYLLLFQWIKLFYGREAVHTETFADQMGLLHMCS